MQTSIKKSKNRNKKNIVWCQIYNTFTLFRRRNNETNKTNLTCSSRYLCFVVFLCKLFYWNITSTSRCELSTLGALTNCLYMTFSWLLVSNRHYYLTTNYLKLIKEYNEKSWHRHNKRKDYASRISLLSKRPSVAYNLLRSC